MVCKQFGLVKIKDLRFRQRYKWGKIDDKILTKSFSVWDAVDIATLWAEVGVFQVIEDNKAQEKENEDDWECYRKKTQFLEPVPLSKTDIWHKYEGSQNSKHEASNLCEVINVWKSPQDCKYNNSG